jgi:hypothetical protein
LYAWRERAQQALVQTFTPPTVLASVPPTLERQVLTVLVHAHASERGLQTCLRTLTQRGISLATINAIVHDAQQRALRWMQTHVPASVRALALDEIYANNRRRAYLNVVDVHSGAVWASEGPLAVDTDSWTLVLWSVHHRGLRWDRVVADDGAALAAACRAVTPQLPLQRDQWHIWQTCAQVQARLERRLRDLGASAEQLLNCTVRVTRCDVEQVPIGELARRCAWRVIFVRRKHGGAIALVDRSTRPAVGDLISMIGTAEDIQPVVAYLGTPAEEQLELDRSVFDFRRVFISNPLRIQRSLAAGFAIWISRGGLAH